MGFSCPSPTAVTRPGATPPAKTAFITLRARFSDSNLFDAGAPTFFASYPPEINSRLVLQAGFSIEEDEVVSWEGADDSPECFQWVLAQA